MVKIDDDLRLNPRDFAQLVIGSHQVSDELDPEAIVKRKLTLYLTAYYLAERFNSLQAQDLGAEDKQKQYQELLQQLADTKFSDW
ncbi:MAG: hypothetical protein LKJ69_09610 [Lactobacillus sp.]|jgi:hypothetical protein|nr:hypothetical protein [Lactobacillus sp.]MCI2033617.1 hypothetical protein [Lactobacillus sp.]